MLHDDAMMAAPDRVPEKELETILLYHNAVMKAFSGVLKKTDNVAIEHEKLTCIAEDSCPDKLPSWFRYKVFNKSWPFGPDLYYEYIYQCPTLNFEFEDHVDEERVESHYQILE